MYNFEELYAIIDRNNTRVVCFPYETAGVMFDDPFERKEHELKDESGVQGNILQGRLAQIAGVGADNKTVYRIIPTVGNDIYVEFWDGHTTVSDKMFVRDKAGLKLRLSYQVIKYMENMERYMNITRQDSLEIILNAHRWLKSRADIND